jgi:hypothetical protein
MRTFLFKQYLRLLLIFATSLLTPAAFLQAETNADSVKQTPNQALAATFAKIIENAIPLEYEKRKDWGKTKNVTVGLRNKGLKIYRRKKPVNHGVWKHYRINLVNPTEKFSVDVRNLRAIDSGRVAFTMLINAKLDARGSAKVFQYGVHVITLVVEGDTEIELALDCEVGAQVGFVAGLPSVTIEPQIVDARVDLAEFHLRRISKAKGPLVKELSSSLRRQIEHELKGPKLTAKLNRAIEKNRDHLELSINDLLDSSWWPLASLPDVQHATQTQ